MNNASQLRLPFAHDEHSLRALLMDLSGKDIDLIITDNVSSVLSVRKKHDRLVLRVHRIFLQAGEAVFPAVADFIRGRQTARPLLRAFIDRHFSSLRSSPDKQPFLKPRGAHHCLQEIFDALNSRYFGDGISASITWGKRRPRRRARRLTLGSYCRNSGIIRINPVLDRKNVPGFFLSFVVYHEMLHADLNAETAKGRRRLHTKEFLNRERRFAEYEKAMNWEKKNL